jgi:hypothetical protein
MAHLAHCSDNEYRLATSPKAAVGSHQHAVDVGLAQCGRHEPVVFGMHEDTAGGALGRPRRHELVVGLVGERQVRHGERAGDVDGQRLRRGLFAQPRDEPVAAGEHVGYAVVLLKQRDRGQRAATIGTSENQNVPMTKKDSAAWRSTSAPRTAATG